MVVFYTVAFVARGGRGASFFTSVGLIHNDPSPLSPTPYSYRVEKKQNIIKQLA